MAPATAFQMKLFPFRDHILIGALVAGLLLTGSVLTNSFFVWAPWVAMAIGIFVGWQRFRARKTLSIGAEINTRPFFQDRWLWAGVCGAVGLQILQIVLLLSVRTDSAIASPWQVVPDSIFPLFTLSFLLLVLLGERLSKMAASILWALQAVTAFGVSAIVYRLGFGFDPFIHQAAARSLVQHGHIQLTSILYAGQYALEAGLARITGLPVSWIDRLLVPALAIGLVAWMLPRARALWDDRPSLVSVWAVFLLPFLPLTFTVPYHLTYLALLLVIFLLPFFTQRSGRLSAGCLLVFTGLIHPLLAIPAAALIFFGWIAQRVPKIAGVLAFIGTATAIIGAFYVYVIRLGGAMIWPSMIHWKMAWQVLTGFPYQITQAPLIIQAFYRFFHVWPFLFALSGFVGFRFLPERLRPLRWVYPGVAFGLLAAAFSLAASTQFKDILSSEQFEFALRLRYVFPVFFFPGVIALLERGLARASDRVRPVCFFLIAIFCTAVWYVSYPQANRYVQVSAPGLSATDLHAVQAIERLAGGRSYVALTPQMVSAAALDQLGFERELQTPLGRRYAYAIPTGGELYQQYLRLWREPNAAHILVSVRQLSGETRLFIAIPRAWDPNGVLRARLSPLASRQERIDGTMDVYFFDE